MAPSVFTIDVAFMDRDGNLAYCRFGSVRGSSFEQALARANSLVSALYGVSNAAIRSYTVSRTYTFPPIRAAGPDSDVARKGCIVISLENGNCGVVVVPSIREDLMLLDAQGKSTSVIDWTKPEWIAFSDAIKAFVTEQGRAITGTIIGGEAH